MNLVKLFETQKALDAAIIKQKGLEGRDLLSEKILALQVELGELANEWRGFKFWSEDRGPRTITEVECRTCIGTGDSNAEANMEMIMEGHGGLPYEACENCEETGVSGYTNPLLEEYVDDLHFILSLGLELDPNIDKFTVWNQNHEREMKESESKLKALTATDLFNSMFRYVNKFYETQELSDYGNLFSLFIVLGRKLGFTLEQIESAYFEKNEINHERQATGY